MEPTKSKETKTPASPPADETNIDKVRELLFGGRLRDQEDRFASFQARIEAELKSIRNEYFNRLNDVEVFFTNEVKSLLDRIKFEHESWEKASERFNKDAGELRHLLLDRTKALGDDLHANQTRFLAELKGNLDLMNQKKVDRVLLMELLNDWALRMNEGTEGPRGKNH